MAQRIRTVSQRVIFLAPFAVLALVLALLITGPHSPVAVIRVVDAAGKPIVRAVVRPEGLRTKPGPYVSGWYSWPSQRGGVPNPPVKTDNEGRAQVPYPKFVFERIETGTLCLSVEHPDYVPDRPERMVATAPPAGAPWRQWVDYLGARLRHKAIISLPDPVVLQKGAELKISIHPNTDYPADGRLFAQVSGIWEVDKNFWVRPEPSALVTRRLSPGPHALRAVLLGTNGSAWFSDTVPITATTGQVTELALELKPGLMVQGQLDTRVPRPVSNGRVIAHVWPTGANPADSPPQWHAWKPVSKDGSFVLGPLPAGDLELVALSAGFVSTNGPGQFHMRYPQKYSLGTNDLSVTLGMEPTARLEVEVLDDHGRPLKDAQVSTWPNVRYGEWSAVILGADCYNMANNFLKPPEPKLLNWQKVADFEGITDSNGVAVLPNLPATTSEFTVQHPQFDLPAVADSMGSKRREVSLNLVAGQTNHVTVRLEPHGRAPIRHF
jgi:hypothetical protein